MSDTVVNINDYRKPKTENIPTSLEGIFQASDNVLDVMCEEFEEGICIGLLDGQVQVSATFDDIDLIISMLETALYQVQNEY